MIFIYSIYKVNINDTLDSIAQNLGINVDDLRKINGFSSFHKVENNDQIIIPTNNNFINYEIVQGDTLYSLAHSHNTTVEQLKLLNGLESDYLYPNEIIKLPNNNVKFYITAENDDLNKVFDVLELKNPFENQNIYLLPNQLIVHKK